MKLAHAARTFVGGTVRRWGHPADPAPVHAHGARDGRRIALTFDDGPAAATELVLDALGRHRIRATFFVVGRRIRGSEQLVRSVSAQGHEVGNHSWSHRLRGDWLRDLGQLAVTSATIEQLTGVQPGLFRAPNGEYPGQLLRTVSAAGLTAVGWDVDPADWRKPGHGVIVDRVLRGTQGGSIVLLHDGPSVDGHAIAAVLDELLPRLTGRGYEFVTVSELLDGVPEAAGHEFPISEGRP